MGPENGQKTKKYKRFLNSVLASGRAAGMLFLYEHNMLYDLTYDKCEKNEYLTYDK